MHRYLAPLVYMFILAAAVPQDASRLDTLEKRLDRIEAAQRAHAKALADHLRECDPAPGPEPDPTVEPTITPPAPELTASWSLVLEDGTRLRGTGTAKDGELVTRVGPLALVVLWDDFDGPGARMEPTPTVLLINGLRGAGIVRWRAGAIAAGSFTVDLGANGCALPRGAVVQSALTLDHWRLLGDGAHIPAQLKARALADIEAARAAWIGPYRFFATWTDPAEPGGRSIAPYHGGVRDWFRCAEGRALRAAEAIGAMSRPMWALADDLSPWQPGDVGARYWWDASAVQYAAEWQTAQGGKGWFAPAKLGSICAYETQLAQRRPADLSHGARWYRAVAANADHSRAFRWMLVNGCWAEVKRSYSMDRRVPGHPDAKLYNPLWWILEQPKGTTGAWGNRREAHAIMCAAEAEPYMSEEDRELYLPAFRQLLALCDDGRGVLDHSRTGDARTWGNAAGVQGGIAMHFQQALLHEAAEWIGSPVAKRIATWWGPHPAPYFAGTSGGARSAHAAPNSLKLAPIKVAVADYTWWTHPETVRFDQVLAAALAPGRGLTESPLDCVPPEARPRGWR